MGTSQNLMSQYCSEEKITKTINDNHFKRHLINSFERYQRNLNESFNLPSFSQIISHTANQPFAAALFKVFQSDKNKMYFNDYRILYYTFKATSHKFKINFIAELLFGTNKTIKMTEYNDKISLLFDNTPIGLVLQDSKLREAIIIKEKKESEEKENVILYSKIQFIGACKFTKLKFFEELKFNTAIRDASKSYVVSYDDFEKMINDGNYICTCHYEMDHKVKNKNRISYNEKLEAEYDKMKSTFNTFAYRNNQNVFRYDILKDSFNKVQIKPRLQEIIINYLHLMTIKPYLDFDSFKSLMLQCTKSPTEQCSFILTMIYYPNDSGPKAQITKATNINVADIKEDIVNIRDGDKFIRHFTDLTDNMDLINLIPFVYYNITPLTMSRLIKVLSFLMRNMTWEQYLIERIDIENTFYAIDISFWVHMDSNINNNTPQGKDNNIEEDELPKVIDNKPLTPNGFYLVASSKGAKYRENFVIVPESIYAYLRRWFTIETTISFERSYKQIESQIKAEAYEAKIIENNSSISIKKGDIIYDLPIYPIHVDVYTMEKLYDEIKGKRRIYNKLLNSLKKLHQQPEKKAWNTHLLSKTTSFLTLRHKFQSSCMSPIKLYIYINERLDEAKDEETFLSRQIESFCLIIIDTQSNDNEYFLDKIKPVNHASTKVILPTIISSITTKTTLSKSESESLPIKDTPTGLKNVGNSCYFNSVLQIFLNLSPLNTIFQSDKITYFINHDNSFGYKGKLIKAYLSILSKRNMQEQSIDKVMSSLVSFKKVIGEINEQFNNTEQQDANEFLTFILESFHEEINIKSKREYCVNPPQLHDNTDEEMSNLNFANTIRRGASFIDSLFLFQLKSNLTCEKCDMKKIVYETNYILDLPVMMDAIIEVEIILHRLPFELKVYYDMINKEFAKYNEEHCDNGIYENLRKYSEGFIEKKEVNAEEYYQSKKNLNVPVTFSININKTEPASVIIERIRGIVDLELEPFIKEEEIKEEEKEEKSRDILIKEQSHFIKLKCKEMTSYIITRTNGTIVSMDSIVDDCFPSEQKKVIINEELNINGINKLIYYSNPHKFNLIKHVSKGKTIPLSKFDQYRLDQMNKDDVLCLSDYLSYYNKVWITHQTFKSNNLQIEYIITIYHYYINHTADNPFHTFHHNKLNISPQYIIFNNSMVYYNSRTIYDIVWENNKRLFKSPLKANEVLWWKALIKEENINEQYTFNRICYPFILRNCIYDGQGFRCAKCPWYLFCPGCLINPYDNKLNLEISSNSCIVVDWCADVVHKELVRSYFNTVYSYNTTKIREAERLLHKEHTLDDCFKLFCEKEKLDDELHCEGCNKHQNFIKNYDLCKPPSILIISLKRFKYNEHSRYKIRTFINYPIKDMIIKGEMYDLYGIVHHHGSITGGHYTSTIKCGDSWMTFDDEQVYSISENKVLSPTAYLLVYCSKRDIKENNYYQTLFALFNCIDNRQKRNPKFSLCQSFYCGEPVNTSYGKGYVMETIKDESREIIPIKFVYGKGYINRRDVRKETMLKYQLMNDKEREKEMSKGNEGNGDNEKKNDNFIVDEKGNLNQKTKNNEQDNTMKNKMEDCLIF